MSDVAVLFDGVWKKFRRGERHDSLRDLIPSLARKLAGRRPAGGLDEQNEFWALQDVSFAVQHGEALGIIGPNGAGKSTTLKLLTRILRPNRGTCKVNGRVGALIEVAAGFHPDLTGRENIYLQGAVMGMKGHEVRKKLDEIVSFAGVDQFIDTPVKRYSSGMNARLGFSIAAHLDPDVMIIDEVLSVGDAAFQERCVQRMMQFRDAGMTIVFVSHDLRAISRLCHRALYLQRANRGLGPTSDIVAAYLRDTVNPVVTDPAAPVVLTRGVLYDALNRQTSRVMAGAHVRLQIDCEIRQPIADLSLAFRIYRSTDQLVVYEGDVAADDIGFDSGTPGVQQITADLQVNLTRGQYHAACYVVHLPTHRHLSVLLPAAMFTVEDAQATSGIAYVDLRVSAQKAVCS